MSENPFRVLLDLTELHLKCLKYVWINVSPREVKTIGDFKNSLLKKFNFPKSDLKLFVQDGLLLDEELIIILREEDTVRVQYEERYSPVLPDEHVSVNGLERLIQKRKHEDHSDSESSQNKKRHKRNCVSASIEDAVLEQDFDITKRKKKKKKKCHSSPIIHNEIYHEEVPDSISVANSKCSEDTYKPKVNKKKKNSKSCELSYVSNVTNCVNEGIEICSTFANNSEDNLISGPAEQLSSNLLQKLKNDLLETTNEILQEKETNLGSGCRKKKRKRHKKRKKPINVNALLLSNDNFSDVQGQFPLQQNTTTIDSVAVRKHIHYTSPDPYQDSYGKEVSKSDLSGNSMQTQSYLNSTSLIEENSSNTFDKSQSYQISTPSFPSENKYESQTVKVLDESHDSSAQMKSAQKSHQDILSVKKGTPGNSVPMGGTHPKTKYAYLPVLNTIPEVGFHIAYKILEMNENYSPEVSDYKEGIVKSINPETEEIEIELLQEEIKPGRIGKFENLREDEIPPPEVFKTNVVNWISLIDPRLIST